MREVGPTFYTGCMTNPYEIDLPGVVSFSGGRTSAFMLRQILDAFGGQQPEDLKVCFQNTGLEHPETYRFIERVAEEWGVEIIWTEYCVNEEGEHDFRVVTPEIASRNGEPFDALIAKRQMLPTPVSRICTVNLKMRTLDRYLRTLPAFEEGYTNAVGLRYDEPRRALRIQADNSRETVVVPMYHAGHTAEDVAEFWRQQPFDLNLPWDNNLWGNCQGCYLKSLHKLQMIADEDPSALEWWAEAEKKMEGVADVPRFRIDRPSYSAIIAEAHAQGKLFDAPEGDDTIPCMCTD